MDLSAPYGIKYIQLGSQALPQKKQRVVLNEDSSCSRFSISTSSIQNEVTTNRQMTVLKGNESTILASENEYQFLLPKSKSTRTTQQCQPFHLQMIQCFLETVPISRRCLGSMLPQLPLAAYKKGEKEMAQV